MVATQAPERTLVSVPDEHPDTIYGRIPEPEVFEDPGSSDGEFVKAKDLEAIAVRLIDHHEVRFEHLHKMRVAYLWKRAGGEQQGKARFGHTKKSAGLLRFFSGTDFVIWLAADHLRTLNPGDRPATFWQVEGMVYHELMHIGIDNKENPVLRGHDWQGFAEEIRRYGPWNEDAEMIRVAFKQLEMEFD